MLRYSFIIVLLFLLVSCNQKTPPITDKNVATNPQAEANIVISGSLGKQIDSLLQKELDLGFSGAVAVVVKDELVLQNGYGWTDSTKTIPIIPTTKFYLASTTKGVTGVITLLSQQQGLLSTSDSLSKFYPNLPTEYLDITLHNMLIHMSGLSNEYDTFGFVKRDENISLIFNKLPAKVSEFIYTSAGYWLTAATIEKLANMPYEDYVRNKLFEAANMNSTGFWFEVDDTDKNVFAQKLEKFPPNGIEPNWGFRASSGIITNIIDLHNYFHALSTGKLLDEKHLRQLFGPHKTLGNGIGVGYGWFTTTTSRGTTEIWSRGGEAFGHNSAVRWFKDENVVILILANCGQIEGEDYEANKTVTDKIEKLIFNKIL